MWLLTGGSQVRVLPGDVEKKTSSKVPLPSEIGDHLMNGGPLCRGEAAWSSDGKRVAVLWGEESGIGPGGPPGGAPGRFGESVKRLTVVDVDGTNRKTIREFMPNETHNILGIEWAAARLGEIPK
jgi:hypothetical protein